MVTSGGPLVYLDTNIVIRLIEYRDMEVQAFMTALHHANGSIVTSELTLAEVLVMPIENGDTDLTTTYENFLTTGDGVIVTPVDRAVLRTSATIRAEFGTKTADAIHVASALEWGCDRLLTADRRLRGPAHLTIQNVSDLPPWMEAR